MQKASAHGDKPMFSLSTSQIEKLNSWLNNEVYPHVIAKQQSNAICTFKDSDNGVEMPYSGAIGGDVKYCFTPTSLGTVVKVESWGYILDLTDYENW